MQDRCIIVPTWVGHFKQAKVLFDSYLKNTDLGIKLVFVTSDNKETEQLSEILGSHEKLQITDLETLILGVDGVATKPYPGCALISGKHPYQGLKKAYALSGIDYDQALLMDCEAKFLKKCNLNSVFDEYFSNKTVWYSKLTSDLRPLNEAALTSLPTGYRNTLTENSWFFEYQGWFFEKDLWLKTVEEIKTNSESILQNFMTPPRPVFEVVVYYHYLATNKNGYKFLSIEEQMTKWLGPDANIFLEKFKNRCCGIIEFFCRGSSPAILDKMIGFLNHYKLRMVRIEPVESDGYSSTGDYSSAWRIFNESEAFLLVCSEEVVTGLE